MFCLSVLANCSENIFRYFCFVLRSSFMCRLVECIVCGLVWIVVCSETSFGLFAQLQSHLLVLSDGALFAEVRKQCRCFLMIERFKQPIALFLWSQILCGMFPRDPTREPCEPAAPPPVKGFERMHGCFSLSMPESSHVDSRTRATVETEGFDATSRVSEDDQHQSSAEAVHHLVPCLSPSPREFCRRCTPGAPDASAGVGQAFQKSCSQPTHREPVIEDVPVVALLPSRRQEALHIDSEDTETGRFAFPSVNVLVRGFASETRRRVSAAETLCQRQQDKPGQIPPNTVQGCLHSFFWLHQRVEQTHASK